VRTLGTAGRVALVLAIGCAIAACGTSTDVRTAANRVCGRTWLTVYSDLPLAGADRYDMQTIVNGERLALAGVHKRVGPCRVQLEPYDDAGSAAGVWDPGATAQVAHKAAADPGAIAYIGDFDSGATATSLQITNASNTLQISPWSPYVGFTDAGPADDEGDPQRYQSSGHNTFARLVPSDYNQAAATTTFMAALGVTRLYVLGDVSDPFDADIAELIANGAPVAGVPVVGYQPNINLATNTQPQGYAALVSNIQAARADGVVLGGKPGPGALALWSELHATMPHAKLFAPSTLATPAFLAHLGAAAAATYVTSPILEWSQYPPVARRVKQEYCRTYGACPNQYALYGYEAMRDVLATISRADYSSDPTALAHAFFHLGKRHGVIGDYVIYPDGNISVKTFDLYAVTPSGRLVLKMPVTLP
jgi:branched-chain amino acid transport system substrate-binding protein